MGWWAPHEIHQGPMQRLARGGEKNVAVIQAGHQPAGEQLCWKSTGGPVWQQSWTWACRISWQHRWPAATWVVRTGAWLVPWGKQLPTSYSRAHQDHCVWLCSPPLQTPRTRKTLITLIHERAARLVKGQEHMHCAERLRAVGLLSLQKGRSGGALTAAFQHLEVSSQWWMVGTWETMALTRYKENLFPHLTVPVVKQAAQRCL